jgi:ribosomal protein S18 acetylase RimI-like enzyme
MATLITLDVRDGKRRQGYASSLLKHAEDLLSNYGVTQYDLEVDVQNESALAFYRKHGFETAKLLPHYYATGHDAWRMVKSLQP